MNALRWRLAKMLNHVVWWIMPEPHRSLIRQDFQMTYERLKDGALGPLSEDARSVRYVYRVDDSARPGDPS